MLRKQEVNKQTTFLCIRSIFCHIQATVTTGDARLQFLDLHVKEIGYSQYGHLKKFDPPAVQTLFRKGSQSANQKKADIKEEERQLVPHRGETEGLHNGQERDN